MSNDSLSTTRTYPGLDLGVYPGDPAMDAYKAAGFAVVGVYLANKPGRIHGGPNNGWIDAARGLAAKGWGLAPVYVGAQASGQGNWPATDPLHDAGIDAAEAVKFARLAGLVKGQTLFLDVEAPFAVGSAQERYVLEWVRQVRAQGFKPALYGFAHQIAWARQHDLAIWTVHLNAASGKKDPATGKTTWCRLGTPLPADPIDSGAAGRMAIEPRLRAGRPEAIDYDRWTVADPSRM